MGDFNIEPNNRMFKSFLDSNNLTNLTKTNTCFKEKGRQLTSFSPARNIHLSMHHHMKRDFVIIMIYTMLKSSFINIERKLLNYRDYKNFNFGNFKDLSDELESDFIKALNKHAPEKEKWLGGNNKPLITKPLHLAILKRSKLKNKARKTKLLTDIRNYKNSETMY